MLQFIQTAKAAVQPLPEEFLPADEVLLAAKKFLHPAVLAKIESSPGVVSASDLGIKSIELKEGEFPKFEFEGTIDAPNTMLMGVDTAIGNDMTTLAVCKPIPSGGEPGQLLAVSEDGDPEWITLDLTKLSQPSTEISLKQALQTLELYGFKMEQVNVQNDYAGYDTIGSLSQKSHMLTQQTIEVQMLVYPPSSKYNEVMTVLHDAAMNKGFKY